MQHNAPEQTAGTDQFTPMPLDVLVVIINCLAAQKDARKIVMPLLLANKKLYRIFKTHEYASRIKINLAIEADAGDILGDFAQLKELLMANYFDSVRRFRNAKLAIMKYENPNELSTADIKAIILAQQNIYSKEMDQHYLKYNNFHMKVFAYSLIFALIITMITSQSTSLSRLPLSILCIVEFLASLAAGEFIKSKYQKSILPEYNATFFKFNAYTNAKKSLECTDKLLSPDGSYFTPSSTGNIVLPNIYQMNDVLKERRIAKAEKAAVVKAEAVKQKLN